MMLANPYETIPAFIGDTGESSIGGVGGVRVSGGVRILGGL